MDPPSYILDPRFEANCFGVCEGNGDPYLVDGPDIPKFLKDIGTDVAFVSHNALFDASILSWRYQWVPKLLVDTLGMSRTLLSHKLKRHDLGTVSDHFGLVKKDMGVLPKVEGMTRQDIIDAGLWPLYTAYCMGDVVRCRGIFNNLAPLLPLEEFILHDMVLRCAVEPSFRADLDVLYQNLEEVKSNKQKLFQRAMFAGLEDVKQLTSNDQFAELLQTMGVDPPKKTSPLTGKPTWAFATTDPKFLELLEHDDPRIIALTEARIAWKTSIEQTRTERMINIANLTFEGKGSGWMPIPLMIGAAHTHRLGGGWKLNPQNWGRKSLIRHAVVAPPGYKVIEADSEQIEARMNAWFCGQEDLVEQFRQGQDVYANFAQDIFHVPVTKKTEPAKRFVGKTGILQLGYQCGHIKFRNTVWLLSYRDPDMPEPIEIPMEEADMIVTGFRTRFNRITYMWQRLKELIPFMANMGGMSGEAFAQLGPIKIGRQKIIGPGGLEMHYRDLKFDTGGQWTYAFGDDIRHKIYGGKWLENIIQFLARIAVMQAAVRLRKKLLPYSCRLTHTAHDAIIYIVRDEYVAEVAALIEAEMRVTPDWAPDLPLHAVAHIGQSYGDCK